MKKIILIGIFLAFQAQALVSVSFSPGALVFEKRYLAQVDLDFEKRFAIGYEYSTETDTVNTIGSSFLPQVKYTQLEKIYGARFQFFLNPAEPSSKLVIAKILKADIEFRDLNDVTSYTGSSTVLLLGYGAKNSIISNLFFTYYLGLGKFLNSDYTNYLGERAASQFIFGDLELGYQF